MVLFFSEQLAYMPNTFFIGDHMRMFPHLQERIIMADPENMNGHVQDNVAVINAVNPEQIKSVASLVQVTMEGKFSFISSKGVEYWTNLWFYMDAKLFKTLLAGHLRFLQWFFAWLLPFFRQIKKLKFLDFF